MFLKLLPGKHSLHRFMAELNENNSNVKSKKPNNNGKDKMGILIGNFIKMFDIKYYSSTLSATIYLTHIFRSIH